MLTAGLAATAGIWILLTRLLRYRWPWDHHLSHTQQASELDVTKVALSVVAGVGAAIALTVTYRRQRDLERARFDERFAAAATQLGGASPAQRLAGVYAIAALADENPDRRQQCINLLCAYIRLPYDPTAGLLRTVTSEQTWPTQLTTLRQQRTYERLPNDGEVRRAILDVIRERLQPQAPIRWQGRTFDFSGATFDHLDLHGARFDGQVNFERARLDGQVNFERARFDGQVNFNEVEFSGAQVHFVDVTVAGGAVSFNNARFTDGRVNFYRAEFAGGEVAFYGAEFAGGAVSFNRSKFAGSDIAFGAARFTGAQVTFNQAVFTGGVVGFIYARFIAGRIDFDKTEFVGGTVIFSGATFTGGRVAFDRAEFAGSGILFDSDVLDAEVPPNLARAIFAETPAVYIGSTPLLAPP